ncbi:MAG: putative zinc metalloprotease, partial [Myxococcaceae bacterium]|nr:putative zinc metalloprotease [Myxococcaceae bacterium]
RTTVMRKQTPSRRSRLPRLLLAAAGAVPAWGPDDAPAPSPGAGSADDLAARLQSDTGVAWGVVVDPRSHAPRLLSPASPVRLAAAGASGASSPEADARAFFARYAAYLGAAGHDLRASVNETEPSGGTYVRFQHFVPGTNIRVFDTSSMAHFRADGTAYLVQPGFRAGLDAVPHDAAVTQDAAVRAATARIATECGIATTAAPSRAPELGVAGDEDAAFALVYRVPFSEVTEACLAPQVDVDATTGAVLRIHTGGAALQDRAAGSRFYMINEQSDLKPLDVTHHSPLFGDDTYTLETEAAPKVITQTFRERHDNATSGITFEQHALGNWDSASPYGPGAAVDAHFGVTQTLRYFQQVHGRRGIDNGNGDVYVVVHDNPGNNNGANAHYTTVQTPAWIFFHVTDDQVTVGDGDLWQGDKSAHHWMPLSVAFDVMAHEVAHGVTAHSSNLKYERESGALNESFSDVMGISADHWLFPERHKDINKALIGDRLTTNDSIGLRDMIDPRRFDTRNRSHYDFRHKCEGETPNGGNDMCGVHFDSGIANRAWSLMTLGGVHQTSNVSVPSPMGWEKAAVLWYETFTRLREQATFQEAAVKQLAWAAQLDPASVQAVGCAWHAVGALPLDASISPLAATLICPIVPPAPPPPPPPPPGPPGSTSSTPSAACAGHANGWSCDPSAPASAFACNGGAPAGTVTCADLFAHCKPLSPTDMTATVDASGVLLCE